MSELEKFRAKLFKRYLSKEKKCMICGEKREIDEAHYPSVKKIYDYNYDDNFNRGYILYLCPLHHRLLDRNKLTNDEYDKIHVAIQRIKDMIFLEATARMKKKIKIIENKLKEEKKVLRRYKRNYL